MTRVDLIAVLGSTILLAMVIEMVRRRQLAESYSLLWLVTALALLILSAWRSLLDVLAHMVGIFYPPAALFLVGFGFLLLILLQFSAVITRLTRQNRELAQEVALLNWRILNMQENVLSDAKRASQSKRVSMEDNQ
jgi:hypothetical protein